MSRASVALVCYLQKHQGNSGMRRHDEPLLVLGTMGKDVSFKLAPDLSMTIVTGVSQDTHTEILRDVLSEKCLSQKHEDLSSYPQNAHKKGQMCWQILRI